MKMVEITYDGTIDEFEQAINNKYGIKHPELEGIEGVVEVEATCSDGVCNCELRSKTIYTVSPEEIERCADK